MRSTIFVFLLQRFSSPAQLMTHFLDVCYNVAKTDLDIENLKGIFTCVNIAFCIETTLELLLRFCRG